MITEPVQSTIARARAAADEQRAADQLLTDATALERLAAYPEWAVLDRILGEHATGVLEVLKRPGVDAIETERLRAELAAIEWLRYRPVALRQALEDRNAMQQQARRLPTGMHDG
jgi:hypothetical protein